MKSLSQDSRSPGWDLNPGPAKYEAGVLTTQPWQVWFTRYKKLYYTNQYIININAFIVLISLLWVPPQLVVLLPSQLARLSERWEQHVLQMVVGVTATWFRMEIICSYGTILITLHVGPIILAAVLACSLHWHFTLLLKVPSMIRIWGSHGGEYEDCCLLGWSAV
jgi:hypothetical protein